MKYAIVFGAAVLAFNGLANAREFISLSDPARTSRTEAAATIAMGPTSAAQKPGGAGEEPQPTHKTHRKIGHKHQKS